ncbi:MAG: aspartyl protease family protein [Planctomycetota bacterium]
MSVRPASVVPRIARAMAVAALLACAACETTPQTTTPSSEATEPARTPTPRAVTVPLHIADGHVFVPVEVDGRSAGWWLLDTGAGIDAIGMGLSGRLGLEPVGRSSARGIAGVEQFDLVAVERWSVGGVRLRPTRAARLNVHRFSRSMAIPVQGILGFAALRSLDFTIDYPASTLTLRPTSTSPQGLDPDAHTVNVRHRGGVPRVLARPDGGSPIALVLDTGANGGIAMPTRYLVAFPGIVSVDALTPSASTGVGGVSRQHASWLRRVDLLGVAHPQVPVRFEGSPDGPATVGRVGYDVLRHFRLRFTHGGTRLHATHLPADSR